MEKRYKFIDHTADVEFIAYGSSIDETFKNAFLALFSTLAYTKKLLKYRSKAQKVMITEKAKALDELLWYALQDALSIMDSRSLFGYKVHSIKIEKKNDIYVLRAEIMAKKQMQACAKLDVKGVSRYDLRISRKGKALEASVVMDV